MGENYKPAVGDRVRVVLEGEVRYTEGIAGFRLDSHTWVSPKYSCSVVSVEKIEPPVTVFKPGDVVRDQRTGESYSIGQSGYLSHQTHEFYTWYPVGFSMPDSFTSKHYEKVNLSS